MPVFFHTLLDALSWHKVSLQMLLDKWSLTEQNGHRFLRMPSVWLLHIFTFLLTKLCYKIKPLASRICHFGCMCLFVASFLKSCCKYFFFCLQINICFHSHCKYHCTTIFGKEIKTHYYSLTSCICWQLLLVTFVLCMLFLFIFQR